MAELVGKSGDLLFFKSEDKGVIIDSSVSMIVASGNVTTLKNNADWQEATDVDSSYHELAESGLATPIISSGGRMYTIPKAAQAEAKKALEWRKEHKRGGTDVGLNTARTLAKGGQIGLKKVKHISKYFARHEVDKKAEGFKPGEDGFPSNGRIAWALWGGDAAWRWAKAIVEREEKAMTAAGFEPEFDTYLSGADVSEFESAYEVEEFAGPEFIARVRMDGSGLDRLYKIDPDGEVYVWDDGQWDDLGMAGQDIWSYDAELDAAFEQNFVETTHTVIDPDSAIFLAARFYENPRKPVKIEEIDEMEAQLAADALSDMDWEFIDQTLVAAGEDDGVYTPEERSENASEQVRDATGRFAKTGARVVVGGDVARGAGQITRLNPESGTVTVRLDNGNTVDVPGNSVQDESTYDTDIPDGPVLDTSGIIGEPRTPVNRQQAQIPGTLPAMRQQDLQQLLADWPAYVQSQRESFKAGEGIQKVGVQRKDSTDLGERGEAFQRAVGKNLTTDAYEHPLLKDWLTRSNNKGIPNKIWYNPITAAATKREKVKEIVPQTSDVQPIYMAVVDEEDPRAVTALVSLVPANDKSTAPMTYSRENGKWVRDPAVLADLNSATPPPVVPLDSETLESVLIQVDETQGVTASVALIVLFGNEPLVSGAAYRVNKNPAEQVKEYWTVGDGGRLIGWGKAGDWKRCVRAVSRQFGVRSKGYCQMLHKNMFAQSSDALQASIGYANEDDELSSVDYTKVTSEDMQTPLRQIVEEEDTLFDANWEASADIVDLMSKEDELDAAEFALVAAGGADRNRGGAEELRKYWTRGKGAAKIRWGTPGDWTRCYRNLSKYMGPRAKGYCALRHKEMNGVWPGDKKNREFVSRLFGVDVFSDSFLLPEETIIASAFIRAQRQEAIERVKTIVAATKKVSSVFDKPVVKRTEEMEEIVETSKPVDMQDIKIEDLTPTQETVEVENVEDVMDSEKPVDVLITEDGPLLVDGHHRTTARKMKGEKTVPAEIYIEETE